MPISSSLFHRLGGTVAAAALTAGMLAGCSSGDSNDGDGQVELNVSAASSTRVLNDEMSAAAQDFNPPAKLTFNNGGSAALVQQIHDGAPADLLLTASQKTMDQAVENDSVDKPVTLATNVMVMVVPKGNPAGIKSVEDLSDDTVVVLCDPSVPCGDVSSQIIEDKKLKISADSLESQVADVLGKVTSGEADAGWVYSTDAAAAGDDVEVIPIEGAEKFTNKILGAVTKESAQPEEAQKLLDLLADDFDATWEKYGFTPAD